MEKFDKVQIAIRIKPETKVKLEDLRVKTGMPYGVVIDWLIANAKIDKYNDKPFEDGKE